MTETWSGLFAELPREHGFEPLRIEGTVPRELRGTLYRCGPGAPSRFGHRYRHWFDGDGAITAVRFDSSGAHGAVRYVQTAARIDETRAGTSLVPRYATLPPGPPRRLPRPASVANTSIRCVGDRLLACYEAGPPTQITDDLHTLGPTDLGVASISDGFSAHPHASRGTLFNFGLHFGETTRLAIYELREGAACELTTVRLDGPTMVHDFIPTERYIVFFVSPLRVDMARFARGLVAYGESLRWQPSLGTEVIVVPIDQPRSITRFRTDSFFQWHFVQARDHGDAITVDLVSYPDFASYQSLAELPAGQCATPCGGTLSRARIDLTARTLRSEPRADLSVEFPVVDPSAPRRVYSLAHSAGAECGPFDRLADVDLETGRARTIEVGARQFPSEPVLAPPWMLTLVYDAQAHASHVAVFDTRRPDEGPVTRVHFDHHVPFTLHGTWCNEPLSGG